MFDFNQVKVGELVSFGDYGMWYVTNLNNGGSSFWVTDDREQRLNPNCNGKYILKSYAEFIVERD
ncbi:hypothetical protein ABE354_23525 [Brevibacillus laterosporus]|uniref:hypothetical protein n=1 Tax=Brevibacillus laterosporus TaxID=1465 RepID=UPI003D19D9C6